MTEYDYSPEAYERFIQTQSRVVNWVHHTERHRQGFESAAPGAPGVPPVLRQSSPVQEPCMHKPPLPHSMVPIYHRIPPLPSEDSYSYVHVPPPQMRRLRPPPPKYIPPMPSHTAFPVHASPAVVRVKDSRLSSSSSRHHHLRVATHSHPYHPPPVMTSPATSLFIPPPHVIAMSSQGHPSSTVARPVNSLREIYRKPSSFRKARPQTPPTTPLNASPLSTDGTPTSTCQTSSPNSPSSAPFPPSPAPALELLNSGLGGSRFHAFSIPWMEDPNQKHGRYQERHRNTSTTTFPCLDSPFINRNLQEQSSHSSQRLDYHFWPRPSLRTQPYTGHNESLYDNHKSRTSAVTPNNGVISISMSPRFPQDDQESSINSNSSRSHPHTKQITPRVLHAPQPMQHPDMLSSQLLA